jgi:4-hydroxy-3-polyprenylbenzoate decarboxylase
MHPVMPTGMMDKLKMLPMLAEVGSFFPKTVDRRRDAPCKQVITAADRGDVIDVLKFPVLQTWPQDGGRFITLPCVVTRDPKSGQAECRDVPDAGL